MKNIGIVGLGFMGSAIARGIRRASPEATLRILEKDHHRRETAVQELSALDCTDHPGELFHESEIIILAVKPQDLTALELPTIGKVPLVSVLAGVSTESLGSALGAEVVIRIMPNLAADIGRAVVGITFPATVTKEQREQILTLLDPLGTLLEVPERLMPAVTAVSGSGIAFVLQFIEAMALGAVQEGLPYPQAIRAARDVTESAALLLRELEIHPRELMSRVSSPGGTTIAGLRALADGGLDGTVMNALEQAARRSRELEG